MSPGGNGLLGISVSPGTSRFAPSDAGLLHTTSSPGPPGFPVTGSGAAGGRPKRVFDGGGSLNVE